MPYQVLTSDELRKDFGQATFFTATDGNHGRGVAWAAQKLGQKAVVHMPKGTTQTRLENIKKLGADVDILELNYDDCVRQAAKEAAETPHGVNGSGYSLGRLRRNPFVDHAGLRHDGYGSGRTVEESRH